MQPVNSGHLSEQLEPIELLRVDFLDDLEELSGARQQTRLNQLGLIRCEEVLQVAHLVQVLLQTHIGLQLLVFQGERQELEVGLSHHVVVREVALRVLLQGIYDEAGA